MVCPNSPRSSSRLSATDVVVVVDAIVIVLPCRRALLALQRIVRQRSDRKGARSSSEKSCGSSQAAKCPPLSTSLKYATFGYAFSTQLRGVRQISPGNV